jgi:ABC-2 type transport system ATP-binding protein
MPPALFVKDLKKVYRVPERAAGLRASIRSFFHRITKDVAAVDGISFSVEPGEMVGFLGPNGAGKTTTLKMLSGLLHPSGGSLEVLGHTPWRREKELLRQITLVMGQRNQLIWDLPVGDSLELNRVIYRIPRADFNSISGELTELLELTPLLSKPARNLSLGERMKCEIAAALLHRPKVLFLDEPTIGLDVTMQRRIRSFIGEYNRRHKSTVLLTSHYMADVEALCKRVVVIHHGKLLYDGELAKLAERFSPYKTITIKLENGAADVSAYGEVLCKDEGQVTLRVPKSEAAAVTAKLLANVQINDLTISDPPIEDVIERVFAQ